MDAAAAFFELCRERLDADVPSLPGWTAADWQALFAHAQPVHLRAGEALIRRGEGGQALYFVISGALEVTAGSQRSESLGLLWRETPGSVIGEVSLFDGRPRSASVWATEPAELLRLDLAALQAFTAQHPRLGCDLLFALGRVLAGRYRRGEERSRAVAWAG